MSNLLVAGFNKNTYEVISILSKKKYTSNLHLVIDDRNIINLLKNKKKIKNFMTTRNCQLCKYPKIENKHQIYEDFLKETSYEQLILLKMMDRFEFNNNLSFYNKRINVIHQHLNFWLNYLQNEKIDCLIFSQVPHVIYDYAAYTVAKYLKIKFITFYRLPVIPYKTVLLYVLNSIEDHSGNIDGDFKKILKLKKNSHLKLNEKISNYLFLKETKKSKGFTGVVESKRRLLDYFSYKKYKKYFEYLYEFLVDYCRLWLSPKDLLVRVVSAVVIPKIKPKMSLSINLNQKYIFFPLHYQPECSTSPLGRNFVFQDLAIKMLLVAKPKNFKIFIKPHPRVHKNIFLNFKSIIENKDVFIVDRNYDSKSLILNSSMVATVTGTAGFEAFLNNKNVLLFGNTFYDKAPGVYKINNLEELKLSILKIIKNKSKISDNVIIKYLKALEKNSFEGYVDNRYVEHSNLTRTKNALNIVKNIEKNIFNEQL